MKNNDLYYQPSGKYNLPGLISSYFFIILLSLIMGFLYGIMVTIIPIVYLNFLITIGAGILLGMIMRLLIRFSHNRSKTSQYILALILGFFINYFQWTFYILFLVKGGIPQFSEYLSNLHWIVIPKNFFGAIAEINQIGAWSIFGITPTGFGLAIIWLIEALILTGIPVLAVYQAIVHPYSETIGKWYPKFTLYKDFESIYSEGKIQEALAENPVQALNDLGKGNGLRHSKVSIYYIKYEETQYMSVDRILIEKQGKGSKKVTPILANFAITPENAQTILETFGNKQNKQDVF